jgi:hypothetical protein
MLGNEDILDKREKRKKKKKKKKKKKNGEKPLNKIYNTHQSTPCLTRKERKKLRQIATNRLINVFALFVVVERGGGGFARVCLLWWALLNTDS